MSENKKYGFKRTKFYDATTPKIYEVFNNKDYVFYGEDNQYPKYLINLYNNCAIHRAIINSLKEQVLGDGIISIDNPMSVINLVNNKENVQEVISKCVLDYLLYGGFALNVIWRRDRDEGIGEIYHIDFSKIRSQKIDELTDEVEGYYYSPDWSNTRKYTPELYPAFNVNNSEPSQILYYKNYTPDNAYYPIPSYAGGISAIEIDIEVKNLHMNNLKNSMTAPFILNLNNGIPPFEEQEIITRGIEEQYAGTDNAGRAIISFNESPDTQPQVVSLPNGGTDTYYASMYEDIIRSILSAHRISSGELYGISTAGKLGTRNEIIDHSEYIRKTVVSPIQKDILPVFNKLMTLKTQKITELEIKPMKIYEDNELISETKVDETKIVE